jgi:hypothetical protein
VVTHTAKGDIVRGSTRATWAELCAELGKLRVSILDGRAAGACYSGAKVPEPLD